MHYVYGHWLVEEKFLNTVKYNTDCTREHFLLNSLFLLVKMWPKIRWKFEEKKDNTYNVAA